MPRRRHVANTRRAISPRLATRTRRISGEDMPGGCAMRAAPGCCTATTAPSALVRQHRAGWPRCATIRRERALVDELASRRHVRGGELAGGGGLRRDDVL